jgi:hypothetical protein
MTDVIFQGQVAYRTCRCLAGEEPNPLGDAKYPEQLLLFGVFVFTVGI